MGFSVDFSGASNHEFQESGPKSLAQEGLYELQIVDVEEKTTGSGNQGFKVSMVIVDPDERGKKLTKTIPLTGKRTDGKPNIGQYLDLLVSIYTGTGSSVEEATDKVAQFEGQSLQSDALKNAIMNKVCYGDVTSHIWKTPDGSQIPVFGVKNYVHAQRVADARESETHRRPLSLPVQRALEAARSGGQSDTPATSPSTEGASDFA